MKNAIALIAILVAAGCSDRNDDTAVDSSPDTAEQSLLSEELTSNLERSYEPPTYECEEGGTYIPPVEDTLCIECPQGGKIGKIVVDFDCDSVTVHSCKDISNIVLVLADGSHRKTEYRSGTTQTLSSDQAIVAVYVKAGNNKSGDGPGYGEKFLATGDECGHYEPCEPEQEEECPDHEGEYGHEQHLTVI